MNLTRVLCAAALAGLLLGSAALAQDAGPFSHWKNVDQSAGVNAAKGQPITIHVSDTCDLFALNAAAIPRVDVKPPDAQMSVLSGAGARTQTTIKFSDIFDCAVSPTEVIATVTNSGTDNYLVAVEAKDGKGPKRAYRPKDWSKVTPTGTESKADAAIRQLMGKLQGKEISAEDLAKMKDRAVAIEDWPAVLKDAIKEAEGEAQDLKDIRLFVAVNETGWKAEFAGAFFASKLVDPKYAIRDGNVIRDKGAEDSSALGLGAFVHFSNSRFKCGGDRWAVTFGLGVDDSSDLSLFSGLSWRMGGLGFITAGYNWARVDRLPSGQQVNQPPINGDNTLNELQEKVDGDWFLAWSFPFAGSAKDALKKPFDQAPVKPATGQGTTP